MRNITPLLFLIALSYYSAAQNCLNASLEDGTLDGYETYIGRIHEDGRVSVEVPDFNRNQHKVMNISDGVDPIAREHCITNKELPVVSRNGGNYTLRLGNRGANAQAERVLLKFKVTPELTFFQLRYAVVLNDPDHEPFEQPRFELRILDEFGEELPCGEYKVRAAADIPGFESCKDGWRVRPWTTVGFELKSLLGQNIQIELLTTDCALGEHAGYAYFDATCQPLTITLEGYCPESLDATMSVTEGFLKYQWSTGDSTSTITLDNPQPSELYQVTVTSATGCTVVLEDSIPTIEAYALPKFAVESDQIFCKDTSFWFTPKGENLGRVYSPTLDLTADSFIINTQTSSLYTFTSEGRYGCFTDTLQFEVIQKPLTLESFTVDSISCFGAADGAIRISVNPEFTPIQYEWDHGATTSFVEGLSEGQYTVTVSQNIHCRNTTSFNLKNPAPLFLQVLNRRPFSCVGNPDGQVSVVPIGGAAPYEVAWNNGERNKTDLTQLAAGYYTVTLTDANGCSIIESTFIEEIPPPIFTSQVTSNSCFGKEDGTIQIDLNGRLSSYEISWQDDVQLKDWKRENLAAGEYTLVIKDNVGCTQETTILVTEPSFNSDCGIYIPSAFSPNGDGVNDVFYIDGIPNKQSIESLLIFDRWGDLVFSNEGDCVNIGDRACGWDGTMNEQDALLGLYVYVVKIRVAEVSRSVLYRGEIALIK